MRWNLGTLVIFALGLSYSAQANEILQARLGKIPEVEALASLTQPTRFLPITKDDQTHHPIVLLHGMAGFIQWGPFEYFAGVPQALRDDGHEVFLCNVSPYQPIPVRAKQCGKQIDGFLDDSGHKHVHLIGHSHGGLDGRYMISSLGFGDRIASLTTITSPHRGSLIIDASRAILPQ